MGWFFVVVAVIVESSMSLYSKLQIRRNFSEKLKSSFMFITRTPGQVAMLSGPAE